MMYDKNQIQSVVKVLEKNKTNYWTGNECKNFENEFSKYIGNKYSVAVSNGSVALELALKALNLKNKDQVIVTPRSFIISASAAINQNLIPTFADVDENGNLSIESIKKVYCKKVKAIILVHLNGLPCDMDPIISFAKQNNIFLIEDCSQAHGAIYKGKKIGSFGHLSIWSFCQDKIISTGGEGGMLSTNNKNLFLKLWSLKDHGKNYKSVFQKKHKTGFKWLHDSIGSNYRMTEMQAAIGINQLKLLDNQIKKRNFISNLYFKSLKDFFFKYQIFKLPNFKCQSCPKKNLNDNCDNCTHSFYRLNLFLNDKKIDQIDLIEKLLKKKISCGVGPCPEIYREKIFKKLNLQPKKRLMTAKSLGETSISFYINPHKPENLIKSEIETIKNTLKKFI